MEKSDPRLKLGVHVRITGANAGKAAFQWAVGLDGWIVPPNLITTLPSIKVPWPDSSIWIGGSVWTGRKPRDKLDFLSTIKWIHDSEPNLKRLWDSHELCPVTFEDMLYLDTGVSEERIGPRTRRGHSHKMRLKGVDLGQIDSED